MNKWLRGSDSEAGRRRYLYLNQLLDAECALGEISNAHSSESAPAEGSRATGVKPPRESCKQPSRVRRGTKPEKESSNQR